MPLSPEEFYTHAIAAADDELRLPLSRMTGWDISPFEAEGLRVSRLRPPTVPEPPRHGEDPADCGSCRRRDEGIWLDDHWRLTQIAGVGVPLVLMLHPRDHHDLEDLTDDLAAEMGVLSTHLTRHVQALPHISRCHVYRLGDGGAHLHLWFFARPEGQGQLFGSWLVVWDDLLPEYPSALAESDAGTVADALVSSYGGRRGPTAAPPDPAAWLREYAGLGLDEARARAEAEGRRYRVIGPDTVVTLDFRSDRLDLIVDAEGNLTEMRVG